MLSNGAFNLNLEPHFERNTALIIYILLRNSNQKDKEDGSGKEKKKTTVYTPLQQMKNRESSLLLTAQLSAFKLKSAHAEERLSVALDLPTASPLGIQFGKFGNAPRVLEDACSVGLRKPGP